MAHDHAPGDYLTDPETVDRIYGLLTAGQTDDAAEYIKNLGDEKTAVSKWVQIQCDINNNKHDPFLSAKLGKMGVEYALAKDHKLAAAMMLHNICAFFMPDFDEGVVEEAVLLILDAAERQVPLRRAIGEDGPLMWALWDLGLARLVAGNHAEATVTLADAEQIALKLHDKNAAAWCRIFIGKTKAEYYPQRRDEGLQEMLDAAKVISELGADWEREAVKDILASVELRLN